MFVLFATKPTKILPRSVRAVLTDTLSTRQVLALSQPSRPAQATVSAEGSYHGHAQAAQTRTQTSLPTAKSATQATATTPKETALPTWLFRTRHAQPIAYAQVSYPGAALVVLTKRRPFSLSASNALTGTSLIVAQTPV